MTSDESITDPEEVGVWQTVSPTKKGRSPISNGLNNVSIHSPSKFLVLAEEREEEETDVSQEAEATGGNLDPGDNVVLEDTNNQQSCQDRKNVVREESGTRQCLPRASKLAHKFMKGSGTQNVGGKGSSHKTQ